MASLLQIATAFGQKKIVIQRFISPDKFGDKRLLVLDEKILGAFVRYPSRHDFRANLSAGGSMHDASVTRRDRELVNRLIPKLKAYGLWYVGIDLIGRYLTEINVTSPAGIPEINHFNKTHPQRAVVDFLEYETVSRSRLRGFMGTAAIKI